MWSIGGSLPYRASEPRFAGALDDSVGIADGLVAAFDTPDEAADALGLEDNDVSDGAFARPCLAGLL